LDRARKRLAGLAIISAAINFSCILVLEWIVPDTVELRFVRMVCLGSAALSLALYAITRIRWFKRDLVLNLGLGYEVLLCLIVSVGVPWHTATSFGYLPHLTWATVIIVLYPLVIPSPPARTATAAVLSAATAPFGLWLLSAADQVSVYGKDFIGVSIGPTFGVALALFGSHVVYGLGREVAEARRLGSYRLLTRLGQGAMGEVWRARHRLLAREAAIKIIKPEVLDTTPEEAQRILRRFEKEAQATAMLQSPHTVEIYDFGITADGTFYYVMELLDGLDLGSLVRRHGPIPSERVLHFLKQVCHSLADAHAQGLVHRDVKPANIFACRKGLDFDYVKVLDFGIVRTRRSDQSGQTFLTREQAIMGTPAFLAPEMIRGGAFDHRSDIYSVGCVAYWLMTGQLVFDGETPMEVMIEHVKTAPITPSNRTEQTIDAGLEQIVLDCLEKEPEKRPQSAQLLSNQLDDLQIARKWTGEKAKEWWDLHTHVSESSSAAR
jgi:serine/threonine-protein kinase